MPASFVIDHTRRVVFLRCWGVLGEEDLIDASRTVLQDPLVQQGYDRLINLSEVTEIRITSAGIRVIAEIARGLPVGKRALVAPTALTFGVARMFEQNLNLPEPSSKVFRDLPSALAFLNLEDLTQFPTESEEA